MFTSRIISTFGLIIIVLCVWAARVAAQSEEEKNTAAIKRFYDEVMGKGNMKVIDELVADNFVVHWGVSDDLTMMQQLGVISMPGQAEMKK